MAGAPSPLSSLSILAPLQMLIHTPTACLNCGCRSGEHEGGVLPLHLPLLLYSSVKGEGERVERLKKKTIS